MGNYDEWEMEALHPRSVDARLAEEQYRLAAKAHAKVMGEANRAANLRQSLYRYYGMRERPLVAGVFLDITNEEVRVIAEIVGQEAREARDCSTFVAQRLERLTSLLLKAAAEMDREAQEDHLSHRGHWDANGSGDWHCSEHQLPGCACLAVYGEDQP